MNLDYDKLCLGCFREVGVRPCPHCGFDPAAPSSFPLALPPGEILAGRYLVGRPLGQGGFGITYLAFDLTLQVRVAVKEYLPAGLVSREAGGGSSVVVLSSRQGDEFEANRQKFLDEARILAQLSEAPNIAKVQNFFLENNTAYFTMEYVDGMSLKDVVARAGGRLGFDQVGRFLEPIAAALERVHGRGLLHRDISPDNVYVTSSGEPKLLDFGAARFASEGERSLSVILKHGFAPEEQYRTHGRQGSWTDLYALAATFYWCLTGTRPPDAIERLHQDGLIPPSALGVALPPFAEAALMRALAVRAEQRFASMGQFVTALRGGPMARAGAGPSSGPGPTAWAGGAAGGSGSTGVAGANLGSGPPAGTAPLAGAGGPSGPIGPGRPRPFGASSEGGGDGGGEASLWKRLTGSRGALIATGAGAAVLLVGIVVGVTLAVSGGGRDTAGGGNAGAGGGGGNGGGSPPVSSPVTSPSAEASPSATSGSAGGWYHSDTLGLIFQVPDGWKAQEDEDSVAVVSPSEFFMVIVGYEPTASSVELQVEMDSYMETVTSGFGLARWEYISDDYRSELGPSLLWWELIFSMYSEDGKVYPSRLYVAGGDPDGAYTVGFIANSEAPQDEYLEAESIVDTLTVD
ncbi:MAG: serine/threonine protein kinase [Bifidobacteriaceae bacterium]|jgi:predicted Ser/Thr protein kinase|nr:serine/threonine protein kinase [Bifidobacteriaceae bacterium]